MSIAWFPGHMETARKKAAETMAIIDVVVEVLDARLPGASTNPLVAKLRLYRQRPCLRVLNKADLADPALTAQWMRWLEHDDVAKGQPRVRAVALSCKKAADAARVPRLAAELVPGRGTPDKPVRMLVMGIPNVGKSTLINALLKRKVAQTGDEPAITRQQSRHRLSPGMELIDTPGLMAPAIAYPSDGLMLAASHAIGRNAYHDDEVAIFLGGLLVERYPRLLEARYGLPVAGCDGVAVVEAIAAKRGFRARGGEPDFERGAATLLQDYRTGVLGRVTLETPASRAAMIAAHTEAAGEESADRPDRAQDAD